MTNPHHVRDLLVDSERGEIPIDVWNRLVALLTPLRDVAKGDFVTDATMRAMTEVNCIGFDCKPAAGFILKVRDVTGFFEHGDDLDVEDEIDLTDAAEPTPTAPTKSVEVFTTTMVTSSS